MLRLGSEQDLDKLYPIYMHPTVNPYMSFEIMSKEEFLPIFEELMESGVLYVYENSTGEILATCIACYSTRRTSHVVTLSTLATNPNFHRQGIGTRFLRDLIEQIRTNNEQIKRIELFAEGDNENALNFYKKNGFQVEGCLKKYYKRASSDEYIDELILALLFN